MKKSTIFTPGERYHNRCIRTLKQYEAPLNHWICIGVTDVREDDPQAPLAVCELCGCENVRYLHQMLHSQHYEVFEVGCQCAGIMEGDLLHAQERERQMANRARRKSNFVQHAWRHPSDHLWCRVYHKRHFLITRNADTFAVRCGIHVIDRYKGKPITSFLTAVYAAFDFADPVEELP